MNNFQNVFKSFEDFEASSKSIAQSMSAQSIAGVKGSIDPAYAGRISAIIRIYESMTDRMSGVIAAALRWIFILGALNIALFIGLIVAIVL